VRVATFRAVDRAIIGYDAREIVVKLVIAAMAAGLAVAAPARAQSPIVIAFSHVVAPDTPKGKGVTRFKELAEKYTDGKVKVEVSANSTLYKDKEELEALQLGAVQMLAPSISKFGPIGVREFEVFDLPFILPDKAALRRVTDGALGHKLLKLLEAKGMIGLAYWDNGFKDMTANKPLHQPADFRGLKMRVQSSKVLEAQMRTLGAAPQVMALSDVYLALMTGNVDGGENTPSNIYTQKMHEVQKYLMVSNHGYLGYAVIANKKFWESLPADVRAQLEKAMAEATQYANDIAQKENDEAIEAMRKSGLITIVDLTSQEKAAWRSALLPLYDEMAKRVGRATIDEFVKAAGATN
jgi:C4-dicarboxylate-binding protein DctP